METRSWEIGCDEGHTITITVRLGKTEAHIFFQTQDPSCVACQEVYRDAVSLLQSHLAQIGILTVRGGRDGNNN